MKKHIHIVGSSPRSGTTLLNEMMVCCFKVDRHYPHERAVFRTPKPNKGELVVTKRPKDALFLEPIIARSSDLYAIYLIRDPRDVVVSVHGKSGGQYYISLSWWKLVYTQTKNLLAHPRVLAIRYEDLVSDPDKIQSQIIEKFPFLRERLLGPFSEYYRHSNASEKAKLAMNQRSVVTPGSISNWKKHLPRLAGQLALYGPISKQLVEYKYESSDDWLDTLQGVSPDTSDSFSRNKLGAFFRLKMRIRRAIYLIRFTFFC